MDNKVLVVVSSPKSLPALNLRPEITAAVRAFGTENVVTVYDPRRMELAEMIVQNDNCTIIHYSGHTGEEGFLLEDGYLPPDTIASYTLSMSPNLRLVILSTCSGSAIADYISSTSNVDVIWYETPLENAKGVDFAVLFYARLAQSQDMSYFDVYRSVATDPNFKYRKGRTGMTTSAQPTNTFTIEPDRLKKIEATVGKIETALLGSLEPPTQGLLSKFMDQQKALDVHETRIQRLEARQAERVTEIADHEAADREFYRRLVLLVVAGAIIIAAVFIVANGLSVRS